MDAKPESLEELKLILSTIAQIREISLEVDFNLVDIEERYRTLHMYDIKTTTQEVETCNGIRNTWTELVYRSGILNWPKTQICPIICPKTLYKIKMC